MCSKQERKTKSTIQHLQFDDVTPQLAKEMERGTKFN
uniref:Dynein light chain n=1 Tax=Heterorhabditis bacteriophora TaxID=37862 RepID=A0A1I7XMQ7_HETBA